MSGIEFIVGTTLAIIPLAIEAYDRSGRVFQVFSSARHYPRELLVLKTKLDTQKTIFRHNAGNLLTVLTNDRAAVQGILEQPPGTLPTPSRDRHCLSLSNTYRNRIDSLEESFAACTQLAEQIHKALQPICVQSDAFQESMATQQPTTSEWLRNMKNRVKLGLDRPRLNETISELRNYNQDFINLANQITQALEEISSDSIKKPQPQRKSAAYLNTLQKYHQVRFAMRALFLTLQVRWACAHHSHIFDLRIVDGEAGTKSAQLVKCELAVTHDDPMLLSEAPLRLEIEHPCNDVSGPIDEYHGLEGMGLTHQLAMVLESGAQRFKTTGPKAEKALRKFKEVQVDLNAVTSQTTGQGVTVQTVTHPLENFHVHGGGSRCIDSPGPVGPTAPDPASIEDFCKTFQHWQMLLNSLERAHLGLLSTPHSQVFYLPPPEPMGRSQSLSDMVAWIAEEPLGRSLSRTNIFDVASGLAEGIMQFYSTPWLHQNLGENVKFFQPTDSSGTIQLKGPYFMARVDRVKFNGKGTASCSAGETIGGGQTQDQPASMEFTGARNKLLFNLGILLLEIGFSKPWPLLKTDVTKNMRVDLGNGIPSDYQAAEKLAQHVANQMGWKYSKIVMKCIDCDFGLGETDLENEDLQRKFLEDVVTGLRQLGDKMRDAYGASRLL